MLLLGVPLRRLLTTAPANQPGKSSPQTGAADKVAFAEFYGPYLDSVYRVYYRTGNRHDAEDLTEQVFLQA